MLDKLVILSSVSSVEGLPSPETSQGNDLMADDITDDIDTTDDISIADVRWLTILTIKIPARLPAYR